MNTLSLQQVQNKSEQYVRPLQIDIVDRLFRGYSYKGDLVFDPFGGLFTVPWDALGMGRRSRAAELNPDYFADGVRYLVGKEREVAVPTLFDLMNIEDGETL